MTKKVSILGSTGSIGVQALEVIEALNGEIEILSLCGGDNVELLISQVKKFAPKKFALKTLKTKKKLNLNSPILKYFRGWMD